MKTMFQFRIAVFGLVLVFCFPILALVGARKVHNSLSEINACRDRIKLELDKEWESSLASGKAQAFSEPRDIEIGKNGEIYVADSEKKQIRVFDKTGNPARTIGKEGVKPGEFLYPTSLALDSHGNMVIGDEGWRGIQILDPAGKTIASFRVIEWLFGRIALTQKNEIILPNTERTLKPSPLLVLYNYQGKMMEKIGERGGGGSEWAIFFKNLVYTSSDYQGNIFVAFLTRPLILKFSRIGEQSMEITYELPFKIPEESTDQDVFVASAEPFVKSLSLDPQGNIYLVTQRRRKNAEEKTIGRQVTSMDENKYSKITTLKSNVKSESTDLNQLLVFNSSGKILASKQLNIYCDQVKVARDSLFLIDTYVARKISKYKISFK